MNWKPSKILFNPETEILRMISDVRGYDVKHMYFNKDVKRKLLSNAIKSSIIVSAMLERMYVKSNN
jgi:hypothetical protein